jgi:hypothetical protein
MLRLLSRKFSLAVCGVVSLLASSAMALPVLYDMTGSTMSIVNAGGCNPCTVAVTGTLILDDDGLGNVLLRNFNLAHDGYQVANPALVSVIIDRDLIQTNVVSVLGSGTTVSGNAVMGTTGIQQVGTTTCTAGLFPCVVAGLPDGVSPLASPIGPIDLGTWAFDAFSNFTSGGIVYTANAQATETLTLVGTQVIPEPGTMLLVAAGVVGLALRRRAGF